jgi:hypothetical protein
MKADIFHTEILHYSQVTTKCTFATWARMRSCAGPCHVWRRLAACNETLIHTTCAIWGTEGLILRSKKLFWTIFKSPVYISQKTHSISNTKNCFKERIAVYCENHKKHKYIVGKMFGFLMINLVVHIFTTVMTAKMEVLVFQKLWSVAYPGILFGGFNKFSWGQRERHMGAVAP